MYQNAFSGNSNFHIHCIVFLHFNTNIVVYKINVIKKFYNSFVINFKLVIFMLIFNKFLTIH